MEMNKIMSHILDSWPYPILFVGCDHIIRYMNKPAKHHFIDQKGVKDLIGKSLLECHNEQSRIKLIEALERLRSDEGEIFIGVSSKNQRMYITPVHDDTGKLIGYFERFELNQQI